LNKQLFIILFLLFVPALSWGQTSNITSAEDTAKLKEVIVTDIHSNKDLSKTVLNISKINAKRIEELGAIDLRDALTFENNIRLSRDNAYRVMPMTEAAKYGDIYVTVTGNRDVLREEHFKVMKDGAILSNAGHFDIEIDVAWLEQNAKSKNAKMRHQTDEYVMADGRRILLLAEGRLVNLGAAEGHPASVMDMSFSDQALTAEYLLKAAATLGAGLHDVPIEIDKEVARLKLESMGSTIDKLTPAQELYLNSWEHGS